MSNEEARKIHSELTPLAVFRSALPLILLDCSLIDPVILPRFLTWVTFKLGPEVPATFWPSNGLIHVY